MADARVSYLVVCAAPAPGRLDSLPSRLHEDRRTVAAPSAPAGTRSHDLQRLEEPIGAAVQEEYRMPGTGAPLLSAGAVLARMLTFDSTDESAHSHADGSGIGFRCGTAGNRVSTVVAPRCKPRFGAHPAFRAGGAALCCVGVRVLYGSEALCERRIPGRERGRRALSTAATGR